MQSKEFQRGKRGYFGGANLRGKRPQLTDNERLESLNLSMGRSFRRQSSDRAGGEAIVLSRSGSELDSQRRGPKGCGDLDQWCFESQGGYWHSYSCFIRTRSKNRAAGGDEDETNEQYKKRVYPKPQ